MACCFWFMLAFVVCRSNIRFCLFGDAEVKPTAGKSLLHPPGCLGAVAHVAAVADAVADAVPVVESVAAVGRDVLSLVTIERHVK